MKCQVGNEITIHGHQLLLLRATFNIFYITAPPTGVVESDRSRQANNPAVLLVVHIDYVCVDGNLVIVSYCS